MDVSLAPVSCPGCIEGVVILTYRHFSQVGLFCVSCEHAWSEDAQTLRNAGPISSGILKLSAALQEKWAPVAG